MFLCLTLISTRLKISLFIIVQIFYLSFLIIFLLLSAYTMLQSSYRKTATIIEKRLAPYNGSSWNLSTLLPEVSCCQRPCCTSQHFLLGKGRDVSYESYDIKLHAHYCLICCLKLMLIWGKQRPNGRASQFFSMIVSCTPLP